MKKLLFATVLLLLASAIFAQTGIYNISFSDTPAEATAKLKTKGFVQIMHENNTIKFDGGENSTLPTISLNLNSDESTIISWYERYDLKKNPEQAETVIGSLKTLHGDDPWVDEFDYDYIWYFENDKALYVDVYDGDYMLLQYASGNYDDDDYYYYGDYWW